MSRSEIYEKPIRDQIMEVAKFENLCKRPNVHFEHGHWWVENVDNGNQWAVGDLGDWFSFTPHIQMRGGLKID